MYTAKTLRIYCILVLAAAIVFACSTSPQTTYPAPANGLVELNTLIPSIVLDIRYATANNFTGRAVYPSARCFLVKGAALALRDVQDELRPLGYGLKVFDGYRPLSVQREFWKILPDPRYVADPKKGSRHNRGYAVDVSLVRLNGQDVSMPTEYDDFSERAHPDYADVPPEAAKHRALLRQVMERHGFSQFPTEWWHYDYKGWEDKPNLDIALDRL